MMAVMQAHDCKASGCKKYKTYMNEKFYFCDKDFPKWLTNFNSMICSVCNDKLIDMEPV